MTIRNAITAELLWGSLWRASLYGVLLTAGFGALYGAAGGTLTFPLVGTIIGFFFGALSGAVIGMPLGLLNGVLLFWLTVSYRSVGRLDPRRYRRQSGILCATGTLLALVADWALHDLPDPNTFATDRASHLIIDIFLPISDPGARVPTDTVILLVWVFVPMLAIVLASWLTGRFVAGWYVDRVRLTHTPSHGA
jgi:hypothetical protein